ncbi:inositol polyphosphate 1-phosphatase [Chelonus insularis]|uniref:inositol polyphosphate 1-phosphatase n=1 Tax=Chelonus insularis TaxID=460826 RepID=UPI00158C48C2|nr:inositol polyphosphate 1-phosphatase [Chelonus insularis]
MRNGVELLEVLLKTSEKAANIARACRQNESLFKLLIQEKSDDEKNPRFFRDFKTLADVLIQETIRHDIGLEFPELAKMVKGEENNVFSNTLGKTVIVEVCPTIEETTKLLTEVLDNNETTAKILADEVHRNIALSEVPTKTELDGCDVNINIDDLGIWIDPIDSTADYISANTLIDEATGLHLSGLRCVSVLIGAYVRSTGLPVIGVTNQPFHNHDGTQWKGHCYWGFVNEGNSQYSFSKPDLLNKVIVLSRCENSEIKVKLSNSGFNLIEVAGAGYKILSVAIGQADAYILSKGSTYKWDTCSPHAILRSLGGGILDFVTFSRNEGTDCEVKYCDNEDDHSNKGGLVAYRDTETLEALRKSLVLLTKL